MRNLNNQSLGMNNNKILVEKAKLKKAMQEYQAGETSF
jgi:hypothetical protein